MTGPHRHLPLALAAGVVVWASAYASGAHAATATFFAPATSYLSSADIPAGFYASGSPTLLENFEDGVLDGTLAASNGIVIAPGGNTDSVDADDGSINGNGNGGRSWFGGSPITFTFTGAGALPTAFGLVWTDGGAGDWTLSAIAADNSSLGSITRTIGDGSIRGTTAEDRFFGVQFAGGIKSITISSAGAVELDHVQYGAMAAVPDPGTVPEPATAGLVLGALALMASRRRAARRG
jgi:hypothetical protein